MKECMIKTLHQFFPSMNSWMRAMADPRNKESINYPIEQLTWIGILLFVLRLGSRRQINFELNTECLKKNISILTGSVMESLPHDTTLAYLKERLQEEELMKLRTKMIRRLIRMKAIARFRLRGYYLVSVDATGHLSFDFEHCKHCLHQEHQGRRTYYHAVLEAKLVLANGMALSIGTEFIENQDQGKSKQDCELNAFKRLADRLKQDFPQLKICLLMDALYANEGVFKRCEQNHWKYLITFKKGSMPGTFQEYEALKQLDEENGYGYEDKQLRQMYQWVNAIDYRGYGLNVLECVETLKKPGKQSKTFVWVTNFALDRQSVRCTAKGGRLRWKTENEGFNTQKNGGYRLEHAYSKHAVALKNFYLLLQIAHIINQLMEKGSLLAEQIKKTFGSLKNISRRLLESLRTSAFDLAEIHTLKHTRFQIRLADP